MQLFNIYHSKISSYILVILQFSLLGFMTLSNLQLYLHPFVAIMTLIGTAVGLWAVKLQKRFNIIPEIHCDAELITGGIYAYIRHPMYFSLLLAYFGLFIFGDIMTKIAYLALFGVLYLKAKKEEALWCFQTKAYEDYKQKTKMFIPYLV